MLAQHRNPQQDKDHCNTKLLTHMQKIDKEIKIYVT